MNLFQMLLQSAQRDPDRTALIFRDQPISYAQLLGAVSGVAKGLQELGIEKGDRVALLLPNVPQFVMAYYGCQALGAIAVPANPLLKPDELRYIYNDAGVKAALTIPLLADVLRAVKPQVPSLQHLLIAGGEEPDFLPFDALWQQPAPVPTPPEFNPREHPAVFLYTSGTTGFPKGCMLSHRNLIANCESCVPVLEMSASDNFLTVLPLFHAFAGTVCMHLAIHVGCTSTLVERFTPDGVLEMIEKHRCTIFPAVPTMFAAILHFPLPREYDLSSLRACISGGAPMPVAVMEAFEKRFGVVILEGDGPTECSPVTSVNPLRGVRKPGSVGLPIPGVEMKIFDDNDNEVPVGELGEIVVRGENVMLGYYNQPEATAEAMRSGWYHTGDIGKMDEDGYFYIVDRKKDMIIVGGLNVYPREVEEVLHSHPAVAEAAVVGEYDELRGEEPVAYVVLKPGAEATERELIRYCRQRLANFKVPKRVEFRESLPKSGTGKILKRLLRKEVEQEQGASAG
ncbi:MAG: long-chain fatty acid--CoA ligase [Armatimonadota bacterium]|nr:long-chain fatty acid--CoA ligase [bacterium]MCS7309870.1 long-chain fatty acid--CoA ligase [Armatimonadota bacterium]MDW8105186.1 long-chain fatty acid--CoA ligase [Armatimonadota bacterium]MDW8289889.1 long-chain fatty acid--CoA ligase [Armatimonadota bacterium]